MHAGDGRTSLCRLLKDDPRTTDIPVIFLTGKDAPMDKLEGFEAGGSDYITKPFQVDELVARIQVHGQIRRRLQTRLSEGLQAAASALETRDDRLLHKAMEILRAELAEPPEA